MSTNAPCRQLHRDKEVIFAGYKFPHPLEYHIFIKVQTMGKKSPREAFDDSLSDLIMELDDIRSKFQVRITANHANRNGHKLWRCALLSAPEPITEYSLLLGSTRISSCLLHV